MAHKRIDQLPQSAGPKPYFYVAIRNMDNSVTERLELSHFMTSQVSGNFEWDSEEEYLEDEVVTYGGFWYQAVEDNSGITPGTDEDVWEILNRSASGFVQWQAGVFVEDEVYVLNTIAGYTQIFRLADATRPYVSANFYQEFADGDWELMSETGYLAIFKDEHGFAVNDVLTMSGADWVKNTGDESPLAIVKTVVDTDRVLVALTGPRVKAFAGLTPGDVYYKQPDATISTAETDFPLFIAITTTEAILLASGGGGSVEWIDITGDPEDNTDLVNLIQDEITGAVVGLFDDRGNYDPTGTSDYPASGGSGTAGAILKGDIWRVSVAGIISGIPVAVGDSVRALVDTPGTTDSNWAVTSNTNTKIRNSEAAFTGTFVLDLSKGDIHILTQTGNATLNYSNAELNKEYLIGIIRTADNTFSFTAARYNFPNGNAPLVTNPVANGYASSFDWFTFVVRESTSRIDVVGTQNMRPN